MKKALIALAVAAYASTAFATIENSAHDLTYPAPGYNGNTAQLSSCQFCHAPHYGNTNGGYAQMPLWNRRDPSAATLATYSLYTLVVSPVSLGAGSYACLSCHDGSSDMGLTYHGNAGFAAAVTMLDNTRNLAGTYNGTVYVADNVNVNLTDDHPVGVQYNPAPGAYKAVSIVMDGTADQLKLYDYGSGNRVECASCHDPHKTTYGRFLRKTQSQLCSTCHDK